uniref:C2H2-type domain-containing protein n=1 Tax=Oreochromis niloticus TaxID=8128 RepID=A0A669EHA0_ORENI
IITILHPQYDIILISSIFPLSSQLSLQCIECHIIFSDHKSKERHLKLSHPAEYEQCILRNALFACYVCDRHFTNSTELMVHQKAHTEKKPFKCPICSQAFNKSSELTVHKKIHFGQDGYACTDCGKPCKTLTLLKYHRRTHTGERPYVCKECGKRFTMSKALQKHLVLHSKNDGKKKTTKYPCSMCKATFKSSRTRLHHMKTKHNSLPATASNALPEGQQVKQTTPIITPISICQPALLQVEPNGPLQKVDANIDTEQIRKLIESLGNVQKVNQVVILGQVPPHAPPLEVQQVSQGLEPVNMNLSPPQIDFIGLKQTDSKTDEGDPSNNPYDPMEQTIILEPITPDGQLENPSFSVLGPHIAAGENAELTLVPTEQAERPEGEGMHQILQQPDIDVLHSNPVEQMVSQNEVDDPKQNLEQTVILELTPALIPTEVLEQSQAIQQNEIPSSSLVLTTELETLDKTAEHAVLDEQDTSLSVPPLMPTVELERTYLQPEEQDISSCTVVQANALTQPSSESKTDSTKVFDSHIETVDVNQVHSVIDPDTQEEAQKKPEEEPPDKLLEDSKNNLSESENPPAEEKVLSQLQSKKVAKISELPINVMSAQELVKVRKRKPARAFFFQGYMQDFVGSIYQDDLQIDAKPAKRQRSKKPHLVVKFGPQSKEKKNKKQRKPSQERQPMQEEATRSKTPPKKLTEKKVPSQKKGRKGKKDKKVERVLSTAETNSPLSPQAPQVEQLKEDTRKNKMKKQTEVASVGVVQISKHKTVASPILTKKKQTKIIQKKQKRKNAKDGKPKTDMEKGGKVKKADTPCSNIKQDSLLLLKGHKQPQLKVYKLDPSKASTQASDASPHESQTMSQQTNNNNLKHPASECTDNLKAEGKKKGGRPKKNQKALSLMSSLQLSHQPPEPTPAKPKNTRKRKASSKIETEGVITSHSKRALECKDCGERFGEVSSLQKHKATVHIVESPSLTYTNGNIFEGVSTLDLYQLPKGSEKLVGMKNAATDWDTETEMGENALEEREQSLSFPALIPSPSLPIPPPDAEVKTYEDKNGSKTEDGNPSHISSSTQTKTDETEKPSASDDKKLEQGTPRNSSSDCEVQGTAEEDIKEDLLLEVDLVTIGEQNERDDPTSQRDTVPQNESIASCSSESGNNDKGPILVSTDTSENGLTSQTVSCSTYQVEIKEEEEEVLIQRQKAEGKGAFMNSTRGRSRGTGRLKRDLPSKRVSAGDAPKDSEKQQDYCEVVYEKHPITSDSEMIDCEIGTKTAQPETSSNLNINKADVPGALLPSIPSTLEGSPEDQVVFELESITTSVEEVMKERGLHGGTEQDKVMDQSPGLILEKFLTSRQTATAEKEQCLMMASDNQVQILGSDEIKVEENSSHQPLTASTSQNRQTASVQPITLGKTLCHVKSCSLICILAVEVGERTTDCCILPEFNTSQCIFYPVKEEEREVLVESAGTSRNPEGSHDANQTESQTADCDISVSDSEWQHLPDLHEFLLQSPDEEDMGGFELSDPQLDSEAEVIAYFSKNSAISAQQSDHTSQSLPTSVIPSNAPRDGNRTREPIDYFSKYFGWDTWVEIANCTNKLSNMPDAVTGRAVARFVGIHIAMGTLKFPSAKLYWEDLTKVPLIAEAMPLSRFLELSRMLKLTSSKYPANANPHKGTCDSDQCGDEANGSDGSKQADPLWKVQPLLCRFKAGCQSLRREGDYAVDQYPLPLTGKVHNNKLSLYSTALIGFDGLLLHVDLKVDLSDKEGSVEKMVPKGSMVFLCKQELSTPVMLERLLGAGVHGAGRVGGARGQIGDEFVSSDGKLMLRRSHCGFILSTVGNGQRSAASLIENFEKAQMSARLHRELKNLYAIPLTASAPSCWPQAVLWYLTDLALVNSWLLYRQDFRASVPPLTLMAFRLEVSKALILSSSSDTQDSVPPQPPAAEVHTTNETRSPILVEESPLPDAATRYDGSGHWPEQLGEGEGGRCRFGDCQRTSRVLCLKCCVFLCISRNHNCFLNFHNQGSLGKE